MGILTFTALQPAYAEANMGVTLTQIAKELGLSTATVSCVLNNKSTHKFSETTIVRVKSKPTEWAIYLMPAPEPCAADVPAPSLVY